MGLVFVIIVVPVLFCAVAAAAGIGIVYLLASKIASADARKNLRIFLCIAVICGCAYLLCMGVFSPVLPAWH